MQKRKITILLILLFWSISNLWAICQTEDLTMCPLCNKEGMITCPIDFKSFCLSDDVELTPKCVFFENKYISGCWKFVGINKINLDLGLRNLPPSAMVEIIGGGETYTLNREIVRCKKL